MSAAAHSGEGKRALQRAQLRRARRRARIRANLTGWTFMAPSVFFFAVFLLLPAVWVVRQSFFAGGVVGPARWVGLQNWRIVVSDHEALGTLRNTSLYTAMTVPAVILLALVAALALRELPRRSALVRAALYLPTLAPSVLAALVWAFMVHPDFGLLNFIPRAAGLAPIDWLGSTTLALPTLAMMEVWRGIGFWALFLLAGLFAIPRDLYSSAALDGASAFRRFWHVTLPGLRPVLVTAAVLATLFALQVFDSAFILTKGGPANATETAILYVWESIFQTTNPGLGAVISVLLLAFVLLVTGAGLLLQRYRSRSRRDGAAR